MSAPDPVPGEVGFSKVNSTRVHPSPFRPQFPTGESPQNYEHTTRDQVPYQFGESWFLLRMTTSYDLGQ